jgi:hypothetical protein
VAEAVSVVLEPDEIVDAAAVKLSWLAPCLARGDLAALLAD